MKFFFANSLRKYTESSPLLLRVVWVFEAGAVGLLMGISRLFPTDWSSAAGSWLLRLVGPQLDKSRVFRRNLGIAFPDKGREELDGLVRDIWGNLGSVLAEFPHLPAICGRKADQRLEFVFRGDAEVFRPGGKPAIFVSAHIANWEIAAGGIVARGVPVSVVYTQMSNPWMNRMLRNAREGMGCGLLERESAARSMIRCLKQGISVGLIVDQRVDTGEPLPFFGHDKWTTLTPAQLAVRFDCELVPVQIQRLHGARFRVTFHEPVVVDDEILDQQQKVLEITCKINELFELWIRERPAEWLCSKRRWPKKLQILPRN